MNKDKIYEDFLKGIVFWGRITLTVALLVSFLPPLYLFFAHGVIPELSVIVKAMSMIGSIMVVSWIVEPIAYFPIVGTSGTYMSWLAGNISNMRVPVSAIAQESAKVLEGSPEGDIISTLGIGVSVIINLIVLVLAVVFGIQLIDALPETIRTAFDFILPAVFGAVLANFALRNLKLGIFAFAVALTLTMLKLPTYIVLPACVFGTIGFGVLMFKKSK